MLMYILTYGSLMNAFYEMLMSCFPQNGTLEASILQLVIKNCNPFNRVLLSGVEEINDNE